MRNMSFALTTEQILTRSKTVTRRLGWCNLKPGDLIRAVVKAMGLKKGETPEELAILRVVSVRREPLNDMSGRLVYGNEEARKEGFPALCGYEFVEMFARNMGCDFEALVTRIEFQYVPGSTAHRDASFRAN